MAIFRGALPDRPAVKLWGAVPGRQLRHAGYASVLERALEITDVSVLLPCLANQCLGRRFGEILETSIQPTESDEWVDRVTRAHTSAGMLRQVERESTRNRPGYCVEHLLKQPDDIEKLLSIPYEPHDFVPNEYRRKEADLGDAGILCLELDHAGYALQRLIGSENFALWDLECRDLIVRAVRVFADRLRAYVLRIFDSGLRPLFGWVGPELFIPPLLSPDGFETFVYEMDKPLIDLIHEGGGYVWVHCHGKMGPVLERFVRMGVDVLNPIEPPPMGDVTLGQAFEIVGDRMALEGNIETHDMMTAEPEELRAKMRQCFAAAGGDKRFILCPSSGFDEDAEPSERLLQNLMLYVVSVAESEFRAEFAFG